MRAPSDFTAVDPAPYFVGPVGFDFTSQLGVGETITSVVGVTIQVVSGTDPSPASHLVGGPTFIGNIVSQVLGTLVAGTIYNLIVTVNTSTSGIRTLNAHLECRAIS